MHRFNELARDCVASTLNALNVAQEHNMEELKTSSATRLVRGLQMINLQKAILAVGILSMFDAELQGELDCEYGFGRADEILEQKGLTTLREEFGDYRKAINVLKHGRGTSYDALVAKAGALPFRVLLPTEDFFFEGDVAEISTLIEVDDKFVEECARIVREVSQAVR